MRRRPDRALGRMIADLERFHPDDVEAILGALEPDERKTVERLVAGRGDGPAGPSNSAEAPAWRYEGVSPWLLERIEPAGKSGSFVLMTPASAAALRAAAEPLRSPREPEADRGPTLLDRVVTMIGGGRR